MKNDEILKLKTMLLHIASEIDELKDIAAINKDDMEVARNIYDDTRSYDPTALRIYAERCDEYLDKGAKPMRKVCTILMGDRDDRQNRAAELTEMWISGPFERRQVVVHECMNDAGMMAAVIRKMLAEHPERAQALLAYSEDCELGE